MLQPSAALLLLAGLVAPAPAPARTPLPKRLPIPRQAPVLQVFDRTVTYGEYRAILKRGWDSWDLIKAMPGGRDVDTKANPAEWIFQHEWAEPEMMRHLFFQDQAEEMEARARDCYRRLARGESWNELLATCSTDPDAPSNNGDLGVVTFDQLRAPFNRVMFSAPLGKVQPPVLSPLGWHVGKVTAIVPAREGLPEKRQVHQMLLLWDPDGGTAETDSVMNADIRVLAFDLHRQMRFVVLDERLCADVPRYCAANAREREAAAAAAAAAAEGAPAPSSPPDSSQGGPR